MTDPDLSPSRPSDSDRPAQRATPAGRPATSARREGSWLPLVGSALIAGFLLFLIVWANLANDDVSGERVVPRPGESVAR